MGQLAIVDLNFRENELPSNSKVQGGGSISVTSPTGSWSASANDAHSEGYYTAYFFDKSTGNYGYVVEANDNSSFAGALAGAVSYGGSTQAATYTVANTS
ncbi:MAG: hypothetical protein JOZ78_13235 [Chroococcidiopsidaceae cyanobacterium CP_BM_ER_R8_30]|nr:hypothetical protein [Chroococcidiopsidaceae cyanobacterium CP_BM_ER_R8_30]